MKRGEVPLEQAWPYDVEEVPEPKVLIRAIGIKERNRIRIGGKELEL